MNLAPGIPLSHLAHHHQHFFSPIRYLQIITELLQAVQTIHQANILHCDIKPNNIMYDPLTNQVTLIDFGIAQTGPVAITSHLFGTLAYLAPEILEARKKKQKQYHYTEQTEIFALGKTITRLLGKNLNKLKYKQLIDPINDFLALMLSQDYAQRPSIATALEFFATLNENCLRVLGEYRHIAILDIDEWSNASPQIKEDFKKGLYAADAIQLISSQPLLNQNQYLNIHETLRKHGIITFPRIIHARTNKSTIGEIAYSVPRIDQQYTYGLLTQYFLLTHQSIEDSSIKKLNNARIIQMVPRSNKAINYKNSLIQYHTNPDIQCLFSYEQRKILNLLNHEIAQLQHRILSSKTKRFFAARLKQRLDLLHEFSRSLATKQAEDIMRENFMISLQQLEQNIIKTGIIAKMIRCRFPILYRLFPPHSATKIREIINCIDKYASS